MSSNGREPLLAVDDLRVQFWTSRGIVHAVNGISFDVAPGESLAIVGESGCGKSVTSLATLGLLPRAGRIVGGSVRYQGRELTKLPDRAMRSIRGKDISMIFQDPMTSLNPVLTVGRQIREALEAHMELDKKAATLKTVDLLDRVGIPSPKIRLRDYPAPVLGRHAPARDDRDGARVRAEGDHRRRADDGTRRDDPGADPRAAARARRRARHRADPHHA